jgi:hypothetical protein
MDESEHFFSFVELIRDGGPVHQLLLVLMFAVTAYVVATAIRRQDAFTSIVQRLVALSFLPVVFASIAAYYWFVTIRASVSRQTSCALCAWSFFWPQGPPPF